MTPSPLELFRKLICFGSVTRPLGWQSENIKFESQCSRLWSFQSGGARNSSKNCWHFLIKDLNLVKIQFDMTSATTRARPKFPISWFPLTSAAWLLTWPQDARRSHVYFLRQKISKQTRWMSCRWWSLFSFVRPRSSYRHFSDPPAQDFFRSHQTRQI